MLCIVFFVVASDAIFACVRLECNCRGGEHYIDYFNSVCCDLMEEFCT